MVGAGLLAELFSANADFHGDLLRNIPGIRESQDLFDDLSDDPAERAVAIAAEGAGRPPGPDAAISRPFDYGTVISYSFEPSHWQQTRFSDGSRFVFRLSGTGVVGATIRLYLEKYTPPTGDLSLHAFDVIKPLGEIALQVSKLVEFTGRTEPSVIT